MEPLPVPQRHHQVPNPVLLGGDVHANWVGHVKTRIETLASFEVQAAGRPRIERA